MSEAPERISVYPLEGTWGYGGMEFAEGDEPGLIEYVRADRIEELVKERDEARTAWEIEAATVDRFAERHERHLVMGAESRARIEELEAKLRHYKKEVVETAEANEADANARAEELEAQLAKALEALRDIAVIVLDRGISRVR